MYRNKRIKTGKEKKKEDKKDKLVLNIQNPGTCKMRLGSVELEKLRLASTRLGMA